MLPAIRLESMEALGRPWINASSNVTPQRIEAFHQNNQRTGFTGLAVASSGVAHSTWASSAFSS